MCDHRYQNIIMLMDFSFHNFSYQLSDEDNRNLFGKCNNPNGHGHNYKGKISWQIFITTMTLRVLYIGIFYFIICLRSKVQFILQLAQRSLKNCDAYHLSRDAALNDAIVYKAKFQQNLFQFVEYLYSQGGFMSLGVLILRIMYENLSD